MEQRVLDDYLRRLDGLVREGRELGGRLAADSSSPSTAAAIRSWQQQVAATVNALSGGSKAHWLARAFSAAFLVRSAAGAAVEEAPLAEIVDRLIGILEQARQSVRHLTDEPGTAAAAAVRPHRFDFVHNSALRPVLEHAYDNARTALDEGRFALSLVTTCGVLEAIITDALEHSGRTAHDWPFETRIGAAEQAGLMRGGCARLPAIALRYRELIDSGGDLHDDGSVTMRDARVASQVLQVVMRDLNPGR